MGGFRLFRDKILDKFDKLTEKWNDFTKKISKINRSISQKFSEFSEKFDEMTAKLQPEDATTTEILKGLKTKKKIQGDMSYENIEDFTKTLWESHDMAQQALEQTNDLRYHEMAMEILLVIKDMEELKEYLGKHGKI